MIEGKKRALCDNTRQAKYFGQYYLLFLLFYPLNVSKASDKRNEEE
ncbi:hypothetical protein [Enterococcus dongliensis]|nr:hypothetical protein [Enterococcus dongliensis]MDT2669494.1 hypothetical protein [Enterococcus dongliensis]